MIENHIGIIFAWGMFIGKSYLPGSFTYAYGFFQLLTFHVPLIVLLAHRVDKRYVDKFFSLFYVSFFIM